MSSILKLSEPPPGIFSFPPSFDPETLHPVGIASFNIPTDLYGSLLDFRVPVTIATLYACTVFLLNSYNAKRGGKPWAISRTKFFFAFTVLHNIALAVYSGWTFLGMWGALQRSIPSPDGLNNVVEIVDALCKIHGPPGLGKSIVYNASTSQWTPQSTSFTLNGTETVNLQSPGRIWNEGLAFYGWIFYISKFYEVLDTLIILAKGKSSKMLQTYHHAGAMLCMWAGIRFMSPPIWMFVFVNSAIHTFMYTYFTFTTLNIRVPQFLKKCLTFSQIVQIVVGASYAAIHSFVSYSYLHEVSFVKTVLNESATTTLSSVKSAITSNSFSERIKELLVSSLGRSNKVRPEVKLPELTEFYASRTERINSSCLDTSGQNFAIWLNVFYLTPLACLFVQFFVNSYLRRSKKPSYTVKTVKTLTVESNTPKKE